MLYIIYIFGFPLKSYWLLFIITLCVGGFLFFREARRKGWRRKEVSLFYLGMTFLSFLGARIFYILFSSPIFYFKNPSLIFNFKEIYWWGGVSIYGFILGAMSFTLLFSKSSKIPFWEIADLATPSLCLSITLMKIACFLNGCCYGKPTNLFWGVIFNDPLVWAPKGIRLHPVQLYEAGANLILFFYFWKKREKTKFAGELILKYGITYNILRFFVEFFKHPDFYYKNLPFTLSQVLALILFLLSLFLLKILSFRQKSLKG